MKYVYSKSLNFNNTLKLVMQSTQELKCVCCNYFIIKTDRKCRPPTTTKRFNLHCVEISYIEGEHIESMRRKNLAYNNLWVCYAGFLWSFGWPDTGFGLIVQSALKVLYIGWQQILWILFKVSILLWLLCMMILL